MKTKYIILSAISLLFMATVPGNAQDAAKPDYYKNRPELGGDIIINGMTNQTVAGECYATFELTAPSAGDYYANFWLLPARYPDKTYTVYKVLVNGNNAGRITPVKGNWQSIGLADNGKVNLQKGKNTVSLVTAAPEIPQVEFVRLSKVNSKAKISTAAYETYLSKAKNAEKGISVMAEEESTEIESELETTADVIASLPYSRIFLNVPMKYSIRASYKFTAGQEIFVTTNSATKHVLDFYIDSGNGDPQYLSWLNVSEPSLGASSKYLATIRATIPITGTYWVKVRSYANGVSGTVNVNVNGQYYLAESPIYYASRDAVIPVDGLSYVTYTTSTDSDPYLFVAGAGSTPGKIVAYGDDSPAGARSEYGIRPLDSFIDKFYAMPTSSVHVSTYSSFSPESKCRITIHTSATKFFQAPSKSNGADDTGGATGIGNLAKTETIVYPNPADRASVLNIEFADELNTVEVYDLSGRLIRSKAVSGNAVQIPVAELNIDKTGIYMLKLTGASGSITKRLVVK